MPFIPPSTHTHASFRKWHRFHLVDHCWPESTNHCLLHLDVDDDDDDNVDDDDDDGNDDDNDDSTCPYNVFSSAPNPQLSCCACQ